jgi:hypothetical protein
MDRIYLWLYGLWPVGCRLTSGENCTPALDGTTAGSSTGWMANREYDKRWPTVTGESGAGPWVAGLKIDLSGEVRHRVLSGIHLSKRREA